MTDSTILSVNVHTQPDTKFKIYALDGTDREVMRIGDDVRVLIYPADLLRLQDEITNYLANRFAMAAPVVEAV